MSSNIQHFHPEIVFDGKRKWLFNPILKKRYKVLPEERVRLQWVDYLLQNKYWSRGRIGFETPVKSVSHEEVLRADLVLYNHEMKPVILIECKAETVSLNQSAATQAARYNRKLGANYIILTNGVSHQMFEVSEGRPGPIHNGLPFQNPSVTARTIGYWQKRGFCSTPLYPGLEKWLENHFQAFLPGNGMAGKIRYLNFRSGFLPIPMDHYYRIIRLNSTERIAYTFLGFPQTDTFATFVLNEKGVNSALAILNLTEVFTEKNPRIRVLSDGRDTSEHITLPDMEALMSTNPHNLVKFVRKFFD